ncbi:MAG TPA: putative porin [Pyrinomonadaceae bacterium]
MTRFSRYVSVRLVLCFLIATLSCAEIAAQELIKDSTKSATTEPTVSERVRLLESELERQNAKLDQLQKTIADQQLAIKSLLDKLATDKPAAASETATVLTSGPPASATTESPAQAATVEQRLAKVEGQALKIGPVKVSGDFRLRFDGTFRSATDPSDPPVAHVQNARARYRFRLNLDSELYPTLSFHAQLTTGPVNNPLTNDQDFGGITARHPFFLNEAWIDYHPIKEVQLVAGRVQEVFADNSRFLFDDDVRFTGFNEKYVKSFKKNAGYFTSIDFRAGQYIFSNPNVAIVTAGSPLAHAGEIVGTTGRSADMFHQGALLNQTFNKRWSDQFGADIQLYRHPNQIQLASTADGVVLLVQPGLGLTLSGPLTGTGNATTTAGGAIYTAPGFQIGRLAYKLSYAGFKKGDHLFPVTFNLQVARNLATGMNERDAMLAALQVGNVVKHGDTSFLYIFTIKGANALISQLTDDDLGTGSGVNVRTNHFRFEYGISKKVKFQSLFFFQKSLRSSGQYPNFFVPVSAFVPASYRVQQQIVFTF